MLLPLLGGLAGGLIAGIFGVGGGVVLVPILVLALRREQHVAHATSLVGVTIGSGAAFTRFAIGDAVSWSGAWALVGGAVLGARIGARLMPRIREVRLRQLFALVLIALSIRFLIVGATEGAAADGTGLDLSPLVIALHALGGLAAGVTSAVLGVGGGVILVPLLVIGFGYDQQIAEGTSLAVIVPTALTGAISHHRRGYTDWHLGGTLGIGALAGGLVGAQIALSLPDATLGRLYGVLQLAVGLALWRRTTASAGDA